MITGFAIALWLMLGIYLYGIVRVALAWGIVALGAAVLGGLTWGMIMAVGALALWTLCYWRNKRDSLNTAFIHLTAGFALAPLVFALGFYVPAWLDARKNPAEQAGDARITWKIERNGFFDTETYSMDQEYKNVPLDEAGSSGGSFYFRSKPKDQLHYEGEIRIMRPKELEIDAKMSHTIPVYLNIEGLDQLQVTVDGQVISTDDPLRSGTHTLHATGIAKEKSWEGGARPADFAVALNNNTSTFKTRPITTWVSMLRNGLHGVSKLQNAGAESLPVWERAALDPKACIWVRHEFLFRDEPWEWRVWCALLEGPYSNKRSLLDDLKKLDPESRRQATPKITRLAKRWAASENNQEQGLVAKALSLITEEPMVNDDVADLAGQIWPALGYFDRRDVLETLGKTGQSGVRTVIELVVANELPESNFSSFTSHATASSVDELIVQTNSEQPAHRRVAVLLLGRLTSSSRFESQRAALEREFIPLLGVHDVDIQREALRIVRRSEDENLKQKAMPLILKILGGEDSDLRYQAASFLASAGETAMPMIDAALSSENPMEKVGGCLSLCQIKPFPGSRLDAILVLIADENDLVRSTAITTLGYYQPVNDQVLKALVTALDDQVLRSRALSALARLGESAAETLDDLYPLLGSDDVSLRLSVSRTIWKISGDIDRVLPVLRAIVRDDEGVTIRGFSYSYALVDGKRVKQGGKYTTSISGQAARVLSEMGPDAAPAVEELVQKVNTDDFRLRRSLLTALRRIGPAASSAVPTLLQLAEEQDDWQQSIRSTLESIDPVAAEKLKPALPSSR